jgi:oxygen-independent coproporphyrinogen-3 oxidase
MSRYDTHIVPRFCIQKHDVEASLNSKSFQRTTYGVARIDGTPIAIEGIVIRSFLFFQESLMSIHVASKASQLHARLSKFMARPQRHRLLHGYPLAAAMPYVDEQVRLRASNIDPEFVLPRNPKNELLVGVLPHPFCNPKISGCGFCTFPHETFSALKSSAVTAAVIQEIDHRISQQPDLQNASVAGLYFGGGTANLTPPQPFRHLAHKLAEVFDMSNTEISLEGVPRNFVRGEPLLLDVMREELPARHFRISMGIQTFSERRLEQMGRLAFGLASTFAAAVEAAHQRDMTASGDLLCNLPSQTLSEMRDDIRQAIDIGLDQICLYNLVMFRGLGTVWSRDAELLASLPTNDEAADHWLILREFLIDNGFRQTSLTNFERAELASDTRRYRYEPISYESNHCQVLGFGPSGISYSPTDSGEYALKTMNPESSAEYLQAVRSHNPTWNRYFQYQRHDLELLHFTRRLAALRIDKAEFSQTFGLAAWDRYSDRLALLVAEGLLEDWPHAYLLTPRGMFYSDSIAALLAESRWQTRNELPLVAAFNDNSLGHM